MLHTFYTLLMTLILLVPAPVTAETASPDLLVMRGWIEEMKQSPRGPFKRIRWFCKDGAILPPKPYACSDHGGGVQHGEWTDRVKDLRAQGFFIANVFADIDGETFFQQKDYDPRLKQILLEQFLIAADDGWIFRRAHYYRGALQVEDETAQGQKLLLAMLGDPDWREARYILLREAVRLIPHNRHGAPITEMRQLSRALAEKDNGFEELRIKIHVKPQAGDANRVRAYITTSGPPELAPEYEKLADIIDSVYRHGHSGPRFIVLADRVQDADLAKTIKSTGEELSSDLPADKRLAASSGLLELLRTDLSRIKNPQLMLDLLDMTITLEEEMFGTANQLLDSLAAAPRAERLERLEDGIRALFGIGLITTRQRQAIAESFGRLRSTSLSLTTYKAELDYLARMPSWADAGLRFYFTEALEHLTAIEPLVRNYIHDRLRGSPLLFCSAVLDSLIADADSQLGIGHRFFGQPAATGLRGLNAGLARCVLRMAGRHQDASQFDKNGIYLLPATTADLPPVSGIMTAGEGNALSHVQLLARNLGIPNVVVGKGLLPELKAREGQRVVLAVSPLGVVEIDYDSAEWDRVFGQEAKPPEGLIHPDLDKLDLKKQNFIPLKRLRASDSGRIAGPKAANLGELKKRFPKTVTQGLVIPFGVFRTLLNQPIEAGGPSIFAWMQDQYRLIGSLDTDPVKQKKVTGDFLKQMRRMILEADPGDKFRRKLRKVLEKRFGPDGSYGVFVRSDTNLEDLPEFTGAGLNLTVPHVVGFDNILEAISRVWASPFTERAYAWRQSYMTEPEHVYVSVLLLKSVPAEKSGVLVTQDLESGSSEWLSVAVSQGVGGAVEGQGAEELRIHGESGEIRLMAQASEPRRRVLLPGGGVAGMPSEVKEYLLSPDEIEQLMELARSVHRHFPALRDSDGNPLPADIEFGFLEGRMVLFQIRPFLENIQAQRSSYLISLDGKLENDRSRRVNLNEIPSARVL